MMPSSPEVITCRHPPAPRKPPERPAPLCLKPPALRRNHRIRRPNPRPTCPDKSTTLCPEIDLTNSRHTSTRLRPAVKVHTGTICAAVVTGGDLHPRYCTRQETFNRETSSRRTNSAPGVRTLRPARQSIRFGTRRLAPSRRGNFEGSRRRQGRKLILAARISTSTRALFAVTFSLRRWLSKK